MKKNCAACHEEYTKVTFGPFCSDSCEVSFHEHAPTSLIHKVYREYRENECLQALQPYYMQDGVSPSRAQ